MVDEPDPYAHLRAPEDGVSPSVRTAVLEIPSGLKRYFEQALSQLDRVEIGDPKEYVSREFLSGDSLPPSSLSSIWVPAVFKHDRSPNSDSALDAILADQLPARLILAEAGGGKSTLARYMTCRCIKDYLAGKTKQFGVFLPLSRYQVKASARDSIAFVACDAVGLGEDEEVRNCLRDRLSDALVVFDGLDELPGRAEKAKPDSIYATAISHIKHFKSVPEGASEVGRCVVTCREGDSEFIRDIGAHSLYRLSRFSPGQTADAIRSWHAEVSRLLKLHLGGSVKHQDQVSTRLQALQDAVRQNPELAELCQTPLLVGLLQLVYVPDGALPKSVGKLCDSAIDWLLVRKHEDRENAEFVRNHLPWMKKALSHIALEAQKRVVSENRRDLTIDHIEDGCRETHPDQGLSMEPTRRRRMESAALTTLFEFNDALLVRVSDGVYRFSHNVFREVLAAHALLDMDLPELVPLAISDHWHGPLRYWAALKAQQPGGVASVVALSNEMFMQFIDGDTSCTLAQAEVLSEVSSLFAQYAALRSNAEKIRPRLIDLLRREDITINHRMRCGDLLGELGDPRVDQSVYGDDDCDRIGRDFVEISGGPCRIGRPLPHNAALDKYRERVPANPTIDGALKAFKIGSYQVTNCQFRLFIESGGYDEPRYWESEEAKKWAANDAQWLSRLLVLAREAANTHLASELAAERITLDDIDTWLGKLIRRRRPMFWEHPTFNRHNQPVVGVNWWEANAYCTWRTETLRSANLIGPTQEFRLPTEAEWEVVARRCGIGGAFPWEVGDPAQNAHVRATTDGQIQRALAVGSFAFVKSRFQVFDIVGNVWEWTGSRTGPYGMHTFEQTYERGGVDDRIARGCSWLSSEVEAPEITFRSFDPPFNAYEDLGFRMVLFDTAIQA